MALFEDGRSCEPLVLEESHFVDDVTAYVCSICYCVAREAIRTSCKHIFCQACLCTWYATQGPPNNCPYCRQSGSPHVSCAWEVTRKLVRCARACGWKGDLRSYEAHLASCPNVPIVCSCTLPIPRRLLHQHQRNCAIFQARVWGGAVCGVCRIRLDLSCFACCGEDEGLQCKMVFNRNCCHAFHYHCLSNICYLCQVPWQTNGAPPPKPINSF